MGEDYKIKYQFGFDNESINIKDLSLNYWESRNFKCRMNNNKLTGKRGNIFGNLFSFDMTKLICDLNVEFLDDKKVIVEFIVHGKFQDITEVNLADFKLEMLLFPKIIQNIPPPDFLLDFVKYRKTSNLKWTFTLMTKGRKLSDDFEKKLELLSDGNEFPSVDVMR